MNRFKRFIPQKAINYFKHLPIAAFANLYFGFPARKLRVIGVTGTEGKTTTVNLIGHVLKEAGLPVAFVSTVSAKVGKQEIDTGLHVTSPSPWPLQKLLRQMVDEDVKYVVLEVTSNGLDQFRFFGINFDVGVLTNITRDHLDYHKTVDNYRRAKLKLFENAKTAILNGDDPSFDYIKDKIQNNKNKKILSYGIKNEADFTPEKFKFTTKLLGDYNCYNCLAAIATALSLKIDPKIVTRAIASFTGVTGRLEEVVEGQDFKVYVDFAHSPNSTEQALKTLKQSLNGKGKLIAVFGSAGHRDKEKRPLMGEAAGKYADMIVLTTDDPRTDKVSEICSQIAQGCRKVGVEPKVIEDRKQAIKYAFDQAKKGDIVALLGKGHEKSLAIGKAEIPWSDKQVAIELLRRK
ncbi:MAG: UDP-N-acetylmuramoyl-L-alanyl-D-glutamate--2,6-diaminopimelate ligase [Patescibacteria group bacterium]|jgi:UDP-N-acetylmuramoyl-L-alanyl-D-glutamate--2,6-diaminopimelate ligase